MSNELLGIVLVLGLTFILFVLRHFCLRIGGSDESRQVNATEARKNHEFSSPATADDEWLLWTDDSRPANPVQR